MRLQHMTGVCLVALASFVSASGLPENKYLWGADRMGKMEVKRAATSSTSGTSTSTSTSLVADSTCTNGPRDRACWSNGYSIATDFDQKHPVTGKTVSYNLEITNATCNPDGHGSQPCYLINGQFPGPTIYASWGDTLSVTVTNKMQDNGTGIHWHGVRQLNSCGADGVGGITECPIAPGDSKTYTFLCTQFGTSWYHSHHSSQYGMGVVGGLIINGPASANYDVDLGTFSVQDWYYMDAWNANSEALINLQSQNQPPTADTILVNGTMNNGNGKYARVTVQPGKVHRLRLDNIAVDNFIRVKLDNHPFTVMTADFVPVEPIVGQDWVLLAIGQRYDVVFTANQTAGTYWFRAEVATDCLSANNGKGRALFTYSGASSTAPTDSNETPPTNGCGELTTTPFWKQAVDQSTYSSQVKDLTLDLTHEQVTTNGANLVVWALNSTAMTVEWDNPTLQYVMNNNYSFPAAYDVIEIPNEGTWTYWIVQTLQSTQGPNAIAAPPPPHPIHLHGHDFFVLGRGPGSFNGSTSALNFANPPRRDTTTLPSDGWLALAFRSNNPGAWLMHCHIAWHISEGLGVQFLEAKNQITLPDAGSFNQTCNNWKKYQAKMAYPKYDSGL